MPPRSQPNRPIKVVHVITRMILGGAQENTLLTCEGLHDAPQWDVTLVTGPALGPEGELIGRARKHGIRTVVVPSMRRAINPVRDATAFARICNIFRHIDPDIVHTHSSKAGILGRLASRATRVPVTVHTIHGLPFHRFLSVAPNAAFIAAERLGARCCDRLICVADTMAKQAIDAGVGTPDQYTTIYSGMEVEKFRQADKHRDKVRREFGFEPDDFVIGKIARLFHLKGHRYVLRAAPSIIQKCPRAQFFFVGDGILREELEHLARELRIRDHVVFAGLVDSARIPEMIGAMDMLVHASLREGLPRAIVQALLGGRPVVSYDVDGAPEVVLDGITGYLVRPQSVDELAAGIIDLAQNRPRASRMGREGQERFTDQFRASTMVGKIENIYKNLFDTTLVHHIR
ncbi:MAG: glycosyltransferase family 4 protein [Planctomycetota bacterium]